VRATFPTEGSPAEELPEQLLRSAPVVAPVFDGDAAEVEVGLDTRGGGRGPAWVAGFLAGETLTFATGLVPRGGWRRTHVARGLRRGVLGATGWIVGTSDPLGFFLSRRPRRDSHVAIVYPRFRSLSHRTRALEVEAALTAPRAGAGNELFGIREYRPGDSLRRIHWRTSARRGELVVREYEPPGIQTVGIVLDPAPPTPEIADQIARIAASEAWDCLRDGGRAVVWAPGLEPSDSPRDLWRLLDWLARYPNVASEPDGSALNTDIVITANPEMLEMQATRRWLVGEARASADVAFTRVGTQWPL
jgi:uncharacterized protein (DUF58 family)